MKVGEQGGRAALLAVLLAACGPDTANDANVARGRGLQVVSLAPAVEARVYEAAVRAAFDPDPSLVLMLHPRRLSREAGYDSGTVVPAVLASALRARGVVRGSCEPIRDGARTTPRCAISQPGYLLRASPLFRLSRDTIQINFYAEQFAAGTGLKPQALRFEKIYQLVGRDSNWRVVREARVADWSK